MNNLEIIENFLEVYPGYQKHVGDNRVVRCPFHEDHKTPNLSIFITPGMSVPLGYFHCFACGAKGSWNEFAEKVNGPLIDETQKEISRVKFSGLDDPDIYSIRGIMKKMGNPAYIEWPSSVDWRGFKGKFVQDLGSYMITLREEVVLFLPVSVNDKIVGGVRAYMEKKKNRPSYLTTQGRWVGESGLLFFDQIKTFKKNYVVLVEGPRDAMRLIKNGIPSIAILGASSFNEKKAKKLLTLNPKKVWILPDNDRGGSTMAKTTLESLENKVKTSVIQLPKHIKGEPVKMDPYNAPIKLIRRIKGMVES